MHASVSVALIVSMAMRVRSHSVLGLRRSMCGMGFFANIHAAQPQLAEEGHEPQPKHVKRSQSGGDNGDRPQDPVAVSRAGVGFPQNLVFAEEAGQTGRSRDGKGGNGHHPERPGSELAQSAHAAHVLLTANRVDHRTSAQEEQCLKEGMSHQVEDGG